MNDETFSIQQVALATGLSEYTLRYYERIGLIHPIQRQHNKYRRYTHDDIGWIDFLNKLRATGMSIQQMQAYAALQRQGETTLPQRLAMLKALRTQAEAQIQELQDNLQLIHYKIDVYEKIVDQLEIS
jgi:DNA-binding transcriptional MerR regulator